ncbi:BNR-4 repeat-containing protein [Janibacter indicus]|uniref:BNR repeat-containing family member n=1 Tax=Janibacter indicus TaxID=857417 RepID=A0A1W2BV79_9MICO|nr:BNR-4 repeat-containing protein [Janibacter indicus]SMC76644.1 BNR repeat-containing family member [Janibacter indicus]
MSTVALVAALLTGTAAVAAPPPTATTAPQAQQAPPDPVPPAAKGTPMTQRATAQQQRVADSVADESLQTAEQPAQPVAAAPATADSLEARTVRMTSNGAWTWYSDPRVLQTSRYTYFAYVTRAGSVMLTSLSKADQRMATTTLSQYQLRDDHNVPGLVETADGRIAAFWGGHGKAPVQYRVSNTAGDVTKMSAVRKLKGSSMENAKSTYVQVFRMRGVSNQYHVLTRRYSDQNWVVSTSKDLVNWSAPVQLFKNSGGGLRTWPYLEAASSGWKQMHLAVSDGHPAQDVNNSLYHFTYDAATKKLGRTNGTAVARPAYPRSGTQIYDGRSLDGRVRVYDFGLRSGGYPTVAFTTTDRTTGSSGYTYKWATTVSGSWTTRTVARQEEYPEGITLDARNANTAYVITRAGEETQLSELSTSDRGASWLSRPIALQRGVQRTPAAPAGAVGPFSVMWMTGSYTDWTDYSTGIVAETTGRTPIELRATWPKTWATGGGVSARVKQGIGGPAASGIKTWLLVKKPGEPQQYIKSARTSSTGYVKFSINRYYPKGTTVWVFAPTEGQWGAGKSEGRKK